QAHCETVESSVPLAEALRIAPGPCSEATGERPPSGTRSASPLAREGEPARPPAHQWPGNQRRGQRDQRIHAPGHRHDPARPGIAQRLLDDLVDAQPDPCGPGTSGRSKPGRRAVTVTGLPRSSPASASVTSSVEAFEAAYWPLVVTAASEETLTIPPRPRASILRAAARDSSLTAPVNTRSWSLSSAMSVSSRRPRSP